jgi:hypothetical protein
MAAHRRLAGASDAEALRLAVDYQLISRQTNCILVHARSANDKATDPAALHREASMLAAGWGAMGSVLTEQEFLGFGSMRASRGAAERSGSIWEGNFGGMGGAEPSRYSARPVSKSKRSSPVTDESSSSATLDALRAAVIDHLRLGGASASLADVCWRMRTHPNVRRAIEELVALGMDANAAWLLLAHWVNGRHGADGSADAALLAPMVAAMSQGFRLAGTKVLEAELGGFQTGTWKPSRQERLQRAMRGSPG